MRSCIISNLMTFFNCVYSASVSILALGKKLKLNCDCGRGLTDAGIMLCFDKKKLAWDVHKLIHLGLTSDWVKVRESVCSCMHFKFFVIAKLHPGYVFSSQGIQNSNLCSLQFFKCCMQYITRDSWCCLVGGWKIT